MSNFVLMVKGDSAWIPRRFWEYSVVSLDNEKEKEKIGWRRFVGSPSLIPFEVMENIMSIEQTTGEAIIRPCMHGDELKIIGNEK